MNLDKFTDQYAALIVMLHTDQCVTEKPSGEIIEPMPLTSGPAKQTPQDITETEAPGKGLGVWLHVSFGDEHSLQRSNSWFRRRHETHGSRTTEKQ